MRVVVTGAAGFIGYNIAQSLLTKGIEVIGIDCINDYYDPSLKEARLHRLFKHKNFHFHKNDITDKESMHAIFSAHNETTHVLHLAAQAGVRYSLENPYTYVTTNTLGHTTLLEAARSLPHLKHFVYASSSSVYGANTKLPFSTDDRTDTPISLYAATKKACELTAHAYTHLYGIPTTGLRYFTVYGPWGRPDMAAYIFTKAILQGKSMDVYNQGDMRRNFTYIDDIVNGTINCMNLDPEPRSAVYNIGNNASESLMDFITTLEKHIGKKAIKNLLPLQKGDVKETIADIESSTKDFGFEPSTCIDEGLGKFVAWYKEYHNVS